MASDHSKLMKRKREEYRAAGLRQITTPLPEDIIAQIDSEKKSRRLVTRGDAIASMLREWKQMKVEQEQATI